MEEKIVVFKFGGRCIDSVSNIRRVTNHILTALSEQKKVVITVSAVAGVTKELRTFLTSKFTEDEIEPFMNKLKSLHLPLILNDSRLHSKSVQTKVNKEFKKIKTLLTGVVYTEELTPKIYDIILSYGERICSLIIQGHLVTDQIKCRLIPAEEVLITDGRYMDANILLYESKASSQSKLKQLLESNDALIIPGYYGYSRETGINLLGPSGTDYTATSLGYILEAEDIIIWKTVDGFMTADPKIIESAKTVTELTYDEAGELAHFGAKVLHPKAVIPARLSGSKIVIKNLFDPSVTTVVSKRRNEIKQVVKSVSYKDSLNILRVFVINGGTTHGILSSIASTLENKNVNIYSIATSQTCIAFLIDNKQSSLAERILLKLSIVERVEISEHAALICIVGEGLGKTPGVAANVFKTTAYNDINVEFISAGASQVAYHFSVNEKELENALRTIHQYFFSVNSTNELNPSKSLNKGEI